MFCWFASAAMAAIVLHKSINEGGGNIATLSGDRINISPDNIQNENQHADLDQKWMEKEREREREIVNKKELKMSEFIRN